MRHLLLLAILLPLVVVGCGRDPVRPAKPKNVSIEKGDAFRRFVDSVRYHEHTTAGEEWTRFRSALDLLSGHFASADVVKSAREQSAEQRLFLKSEADLTEDEIAEVESTTFRSADAHYLDECFLLNEALRSLELDETPSEQRAEDIFRWMTRNVLLHEQGDSWTPPAFTLRRGRGSAIERALVFLAMLRQARIDGCLIVLPEKDVKHFLVGVVAGDEKSSRLRLFDTRLGLAIWTKDGQRPASLHDALAEPTILSASQITADHAKKLEAWLVCPLYAMAPRMAELQKGLSRHLAVTTHLRAMDLAKNVRTASGLSTKVWNPRKEAGAAENSPTRCLRMFLPKQEGGVDESHRATLAGLARLPLADIFANYAEIQFTDRLLPPTAHAIMTNITVSLLNKYELQPREMFLRGQFDPLLRRFERLQAFAQDESLFGLVDNEQFRTDLREWQKQLIDANANASHEDPKMRAKAQQDMQALWNRDQFIGWMLALDKEERLEKKHEKTVLTKVLAVGMREHFEAELLYVQAALHQEKAEVAQSLLRRQQAANAAAKLRVQEDWDRAASGWRFYVERVAIESAIERILRKARAVVPNPKNPFDQIDRQIGLLETLHLTIHKYFHAKLAQVECLERMEGAKGTPARLRAIQAEIETLLKNGAVAADIKTLSQDRFAKEQPRNQKRLTLLARDWGDAGNLAWIKRHVEHRLAKAS
ncbi:MAG: hypothetical protein FJ303_12200 [Planctomycetes bacterium]|nr:hypothetical protein [Planctomycetota bacterium]